EPQNSGRAVDLRGTERPCALPGKSRSTPKPGRAGKPTLARKIRVHELAKEHGLTNKETLQLSLSPGVGVQTHSARLGAAQGDTVRRKADRERLIRDEQPDPSAPKKAASKKAAPKKAAAEPAAEAQPRKVEDSPAAEPERRPAAEPAAKQEAPVRAREERATPDRPDEGGASDEQGSGAEAAPAEPAEAEPAEPKP